MIAAETRAAGGQLTKMSWTKAFETVAARNMERMAEQQLTSSIIGRGVRMGLRQTDSMAAIVVGGACAAQAVTLAGVLWTGLIGRHGFAQKPVLPAS